MTSKDTARQRLAWVVAHDRGACGERRMTWRDVEIMKNWHLSRAVDRMAKRITP